MSIDVQKAVSLFNLSEPFNKADVDSAFGRESAQIQQKIASAPTDALKAKFEQKQALLTQAYSLLLTELTSVSTSAQATPEQSSSFSKVEGSNKEKTAETVEEKNEENPLQQPSKSKSTASPLSQTKLADLPGMAGADTTQIELQPGHVIANRYEVKELIGQGGMGVVYRAFDKNRDADIAIKMLLPQLTKNESAKQRFLEEARLSSQLSHPNIVNVFDVQIDNDLCFLTMELLEGQELRAYLTNLNTLKQEMPIDEAKRIISELLTALEHAHQTTVHRDIKPENIWLMPNGQIKLMDFGIARLMSTTQRTQTGAATGTAYYMAPEQLQGKDVDARADLYAVGVLLYEMLTGQIPMGRFASAIEHRKEIGKGLSSVIDQVLEVNPEQRFSSASLLNQAITQGKQGKVKKRQTANNQLTQQAPNKGVIVAVIVLFVIGLGFAGYTGHLDFLKPIDKELLAEKQSDANKLLGQIKTLRKRLDNKLRELKSDVKGAKRNNDSNLNHLSQWQELAELHIQDSDDVIELEGNQNAAEAAFKQAKTPEQTQKAIAKLTEVKKQSQNLVNRFDNIKAYLSQIPKTEQAKQAYFKFKDTYQITDTPSQEQEASEQLTKAKEYKTDSEFGSASKALKQAAVAFHEGNNCCTEHVSTMEAKWAKAKADKLAREKAAALERFKNGKTLRFSGVSMKLEGIPSGSFTMGSNNGDSDEKPTHRVSVNAFYMQAHEVTWAQYQPCIDAGACEYPADEGGDEGWGKGNRPMINVSWNDVQTYIKWLNKQGIGKFRLPSEAEWEYAARAGTSTKYSWGDSISCSRARYGYYSDECGKQKSTDPVKSYSANGFGLYDMHGNVWEWVQDCYNDNYHGAPSNGSAWQSGSCEKRVLRGGSWYYLPNDLRSADRGRNTADFRLNSLGFRLVQDF